MFNKRKSKSNVQLGTNESTESNPCSSSAKNLSSSLEFLDHISGTRDLLPTLMSPTRDLRPGPSSSHVDVCFLGMVQDVNLGGSRNERGFNLGGSRNDKDVQLIDKVEEAQLEGKINLVASDELKVGLAITRHGVKVIRGPSKEVLQRHPLHTVAQVVHYLDSFNKHNLVLKIGTVGRTVYHVYLFQCPNEDAAQEICQRLKQVYDTVTLETA